MFLRKVHPQNETGMSVISRDWAQRSVIKRKVHFQGQAGRRMFSIKKVRT